jgi:hypothetical protein
MLKRSDVQVKIPSQKGALRANPVDLANFRLVDLRRPYDLFAQLVFMPTPEWRNAHYSDAESWAGTALHKDQEFIQRVVDAVRNAQFIQKSSCCPSPFI